MKFIDLHCDTAMRMYEEKGKLKKNDFSIDIEKLKKGECMAQVFAFFIELSEVSDPYKYFLNMYDNFIKEIQENSKEIEIVRNVDELEKANLNNKLGAFLSIEEGEVLKGSIDNLRDVYDKGIRLITLTWNFENSIGYPNINFKYKEKGLKPRGKEIVEKCEELGIIPDASHLSDGGFYDLVDICKKPFIATHSNAREITYHPRNLTDDMIKKLADKGGVMGINFSSDFLGESFASTIEEMITHIKHIKNIGGIDVIGLGSDFDGIENQVEIKDSSEFPKLYEALKKAGFSENEMEKIFYKNVLRVFKETL
ncbi:putative peptidase, M19 family [Clostridium neonatale]|uniref:dipeptidase n=1 Tax=Clostridium neonatale TaxID=137838 RepID=UPI00291C21F8|nr:putative peptidase, M19 family [Clostridium neonatale]